MKRILTLLLLGILCAVTAWMLTGDTPSTSESAATRPASASNDLVPIATSASSYDAQPAADSSTSANAEGLPPKPPSSSLNSPGEVFDFSSYLNNGRVTIAYFYADWCPACRQVSPVMASINRDNPKAQVLFLNIGTWNSPIAERYDVTFVPYLRVYDQEGSLIVEGREANRWIQEFGSGQIRN